MGKQIEENTGFAPDFDKLNKIANTNAGVIPAIVQHAGSKDVLMLGYMNQQALAETIRTGIVTFWSTSRNALWIKGKTSGNYLKVVNIRVNCEQNSLLVMCSPEGDGVCHTKTADGQYRSTCYYREISQPGELSFVAV